MTSTLCPSAALALLFRAIVEIILAIAAIARTTLHQVGPCCRKAGQRLLAHAPAFSRPQQARTMPIAGRRWARIMETFPTSPSWPRLRKGTSLIAAMLLDRKYDGKLSRPRGTSRSTKEAKRLSFPPRKVKGPAGLANSLSGNKGRLITLSRFSILV